MPRYDVFLSHAGGDKPAVERLATKLREAGVEPFLDKWHLIPGQPWQEALEEALDESRTCAVFIGKVIGPWQNEEMRSALAERVRDHSIRVIPVLLPGGKELGKEEPPRFLRRLTWVDFRAGLDDEDAFERLLAGIRGEAPGPASSEGAEKPLPLLYRCMAPPRESFVARREYEEAVQALLAGGGKERAATVGLTTALRGAGGFGKTALATELCYDPRVREQYPDGILWTTLGEEIDAAGRLVRVRDLIRWWTEEDPPTFETVSAASAQLRQELETKRLLLVVDDVWRPEDVTPFQGLGSRAALLVTTRDSRTLPADSVPIHVDAMDIPEAVHLLGAGLPDGTGVDLKGLAKRLGEWPLLLKIVNRQLRELVQNHGLLPELALREVEEALDAEGLTAFDHEDFESRGQAVARTVGASLRRLSGEEVERFEQLAIFPEDKDVPLRVLESLWGLGSYAGKKLCGRLHDLSLLLRFDRAAGTIRLHDVIRAYLVKKSENQLVGWHRRLLDAYRPANSRWPDLPREESYLWNHLFHHLIEAGQSDVCRGLLLDFQYLGSKLGATDVSTLLGDYSLFAEKDAEFRLVRDAFRLSAHVLARNPAQLREQLWGRLQDRREAGIRRLLQASEGSRVPWLRPRIASLARPGGPLIRTIAHPGVPTALAVLPDGRVVSGSESGALRVWDVASGQALQVLEGHASEVNAVAVLDSRRVVSGSVDMSLRVWDVESGQALQVLGGYGYHQPPGAGSAEGQKLKVPAGSMAVLDSQRVVFGSEDGLRMWDLESGETLQLDVNWHRHRNQVQGIVVLAGRRVVTGSGVLLFVWDVERNRVTQLLRGHSKEVRVVAGLVGRQVVSGSDDKTLRVWDVKGGQTLQVLAGHSSGVSAVASLDSRRVVSGSENGELRVWDVGNGQALSILAGHSDKVRALAVLTNGQVVSGSSDRTLRVWNLENDQDFSVLEGHIGAISTVSVIDCKRVISGSFDRTLRVWGIEKGVALQVLEGHADEVRAVAVLDDQRVVSGSLDGTLRVWDLETGKLLRVLEGHSLWVRTLVALDSRRVVSGSDDRTLRVWDLERRTVLRVLRGHSAGVRAMAVLGSRRVVSGSDDRTLRVWDLERRPPLRVLEGHSAGIRAVAILDSRRVVSGSDDRTLRVWDVESGQTLQILEGHLSGVGAVAVLGSRRVVSGSEDGMLRVWDIESGKTLCVFMLDAPLTAVATDRQTQLIVAGDASGRVHYFDLVES